MKILELFSGTESFSKVARVRGHETFTIDINENMKPNLVKDILKVKLEDIPFKPDVIWASPPCVDYSHAKRTGTSFIELSNMYVIKTISLIMALKPKFWIIENPQTGRLKFQYFMVDLPFTDVSYCKYGFQYRKQTRLWNNFNFEGEICKKDCEFIKKGRHMASAGNGRKKYTDKNYKTKEKYKIPKELCEEILSELEDFAD